MIFVHSRGSTGTTAARLRDLAIQHQVLKLFMAEEESGFAQARKTLQKSRNKQLKEVFESGFGIHHAGMFILAQFKRNGTWLLLFPTIHIIFPARITVSVRSGHLQCSFSIAFL